MQKIHSIWTLIFAICSTSGIKFLGTYKVEEREAFPVYGITRKMNPNNFVDVYFGEIVALSRDVIKAPGIKNKLRYIIMPPGWSHTGNHTTAKIIKQEFDKNRLA